MPSTSAKQARTMAAAAHDPEFARKMGISFKVAKEFNDADAGTGIRSESPFKNSPEKPKRPGGISKIPFR